MIDADNDLSFKHAIEVFESHNLEYDVKEGAAMIWVQGRSGKVYSYYPTTHRWAPRSLRGKHYRAKSTEDFLERFVFRGDERKESYAKVLKTTFRLDHEATMSDLVNYIWDDFDGGVSKTEVISNLMKLAWNEVKLDVETIDDS